MAAFHASKPVKQRGFAAILLTFVFLVILITGIAAGVSVYWYRQHTQPLGSSETHTVVVISEGLSVFAIGQLLEKEGIIRSATAFDWYTRLNSSRTSLQAGSYKFSPSESVAEIVEKLRNGEVATDVITILPAQRLDQIKSTFLKAGFSQEQIDEAFNPQTHSAHPALAYKPSSASLEGYLYPETFQRTTITTATELVRASLDETAKLFTVDVVQRLKAQNLSVHEAVILASIVEREVPAASDDRPTVAQVYLKRLSENIALEADPTALYGTILATGSQDGWRWYDTPYNTYLYPGLPPGPIANISKTSLMAVANPSNTDFLFFVADDNDDNVTHFSRTLAEHEAAIARYCRVKCAGY